MSFYRKYRPQTITEIDSVTVREKLSALLSKDTSHLPHAYLFSGPRGTGKTTAARVVAKLFNCTKPKKVGPCGTCDQCKSIAMGTNIDVMELDAASNRGIDDIRQLRDAIHIAPARAKYKVYIVDEVHMLTTEAFNALLKTLEEPPPHGVFVLATTDPKKVPATITSRCLHIVFDHALPEELLAVVMRIAKREKMTIDRDALILIASYADGSFRDAVKFLEQVSFRKGKITSDVVRKNLAVSNTKVQESFLAALKAKDTRRALTLVESVVSEGQDSRTFLADSLQTLHHRLIDAVKDGGADTQGIADMKDILSVFSPVYPQMKYAAIPQLPLELAVMEYCGIGDSLDQSQAPVKEMEHADVPAKGTRGFITVEKLIDHWKDIIDELKSQNHSVAGVLRSARPKSVTGSTVTIEAFYTFHKDRLSDVGVRGKIAAVLKKFFGVDMTVEVVMGKK